MPSRKIPAIAVAAMLVLTAFASVPVAAQEASVAVETLTPTDVTTDAATLHGNLTDLSAADDASVRFEYWEQGDPENASESPNLTASGVGEFGIDVVDLEPDTTYVAVAHAETETASGVGGEVTFTTDVEEAVAVSTRDSGDVTNDSATLHGELTELRGAGSATVWFEYWVDGDRSDSSTTTELALDEPGAFSAAADGLAGETDYVYVAHAETGNASAAGDEVDFTTEADVVPLGVETDDAKDVANRSATLRGELTGLGGDDTATVWFEYWVAGEPDEPSETNGQTLDEAGAFSADVDGLEEDTTYVYVAHARDDGTVAGDEVEFTTGEAASDGPSRDRERPFGQWLTSWLKNVLPADADVPFGQLVSELVTENNPGADKRSDEANPGGNGNGPPDHAGGDGEDDEDDEDVED